MKVISWDISELQNSDYFEYDKYIFCSDEVGKSLKDLNLISKLKVVLHLDVSYDLERKDRKMVLDFVITAEKNLLIMIFATKIAILSLEELANYTEGEIRHMNVYIKNIKDYKRGKLLNSIKKEFLIIETRVLDINYFIHRLENCLQ